MVVELDAQFVKMGAARKQLESTYMSAFGTPTARAAEDAVRNQIKAMYENRIAASKAGSRGASAQAAQLQKDLKKYQETACHGSIRSPCFWFPARANLVVTTRRY
jgi:hypothetical protein